MTKELHPAPLHLRFVGKDEDHIENTLVYVHQNFLTEVADFNFGDFARLVSDIYGMPITMDLVEEEPQPRITALSSEHIPKAILFDAVNYPATVYAQHAHQSFARAVYTRILEAAQKLDMTPDMLEKSVQIADNPEAPGVQRIFAVQRRVNPAYAYFVATVQWKPKESGFVLDLSEIVVKEGEFGRAQ